MRLPIAQALQVVNDDQRAEATALLCDGQTILVAREGGTARHGRGQLPSAPWAQPSPLLRTPMPLPPLYRAAAVLLRDSAPNANSRGLATACCSNCACCSAARQASNGVQRPQAARRGGRGAFAMRAVLLLATATVCVAAPLPANQPAASSASSGDPLRLSGMRTLAGQAQPPASVELGLLGEIDQTWASDPSSRYHPLIERLQLLRVEDREALRSAIEEAWDGGDGEGAAMALGRVLAGNLLRPAANLPAVPPPHPPPRQPHEVPPPQQQQPRPRVASHAAVPSTGDDDSWSLGGAGVDRGWRVAHGRSDRGEVDVLVTDGESWWTCAPSVRFAEPALHALSSAAAGADAAAGAPTPWARHVPPDTPLLPPLHHGFSLRRGHPLLSCPLRPLLFPRGWESSLRPSSLTRSICERSWGGCGRAPQPRGACKPGPVLQMTCSFLARLQITSILPLKKGSLNASTAG